MIISHKYKFIFIKTRKTAGTSIEVFLSEHCDEKDILTPVRPVVESHKARNYMGIWNPARELRTRGVKEAKLTVHDLLRRRKFYNHIPALIVRERISKKMWNSYFKFCVERNPWDKTLSHYSMMKDRNGGDLNFEEYLAKGDFCINYPLYTDRKKKVIVDHIIKYEDLNQELSAIFGTLGIPFEGQLAVKAKSNHRSDKRPYRKVYTEAQRRIIEKAFQHEIKLLDYQY